MRWFDRCMLRLRTLFRRDDVEAELNAEFEFHVEQQLAENLAAGMPPKEARDAALRSTGAITQFQEQCREERGLNLLDTTLQDVRYAIRSLRQSPGFTTVAVLSLALGIGANTAVFSLMDSLLLSSLPVKDPQRLVFISTNREKIGNFEVSRTLLFRNLEQLQKQAIQTEGVGSYEGAERLSVAVAGHAELSAGDFVSGNYFQILGVPARIGRTIVPADDARSGNAAAEGWPAMISTGYWQRRFAQDPGVVGQRITVNTVPFVIVGVLPSNFSGLSVDEPADVMMPMIASKQVSASSAAAGFPKPEESAGEVFAKLKDGVSQS